LNELTAKQVLCPKEETINHF